MDQQILERFFKGECSEEEQRRIIHWYRSGEADQPLADKIEAYWKEQARKKTDLWGRENLYASIHEQIQPPAQEEKVIPLQKRSDTRQYRKAWNFAAAVALLMVSLGWLYYHFFYEHTLNSNLAEKTSPEENIIIKRTARGEKLTLMLDDSTVVKLNSESQLRYKAASVREVYLQGEAYFEVKRDPLQPFQIHTGNITTTVLGTSFNIKAFDIEEEVEVSVVSGKVKVTRLEAQHQVQKQHMYVIPGEQVIWKHTDTLFVKKVFDEQEVLSWKEGRLYFKNARFAEVIATLERWYGVEIEVQRQGIEDGFSGSYTKRSLESVLEGMSFVLNFEYEIYDKKILIK